jgi:glycine oxidase
MRVAVIGAGVVGLAVAWRLSREGDRVEVFDDRPGAGASHAAAGMLAPAGEAWFGEDALLALGAESAGMWPGFAETLGRESDHDVWLRREPALMVGTDEADRADLDRVHRLLRSHDLAVDPLTRREARRLEPALTTSLRRALLVRGDLSVHNRRVVDALRRACDRAGAPLRPERADVVTDHGGAAIGVRARGSGNVHRADVVVVAAGHGTSAVGGVPESLRSAVRPVKGEILRLRGHEPLLTRTVRARVRGDAVYAVPRADGEIVLGATSEEQGDLRVTADGVFELLRRGISVVPGIRDCELVEATAGARPGTADNGPLIGHTGLPNLLAATGHYRGGVLMAPVTAEAIAALLHGRPVHDTVRPFAPTRFATPSPRADLAQAQPPQ